MTLDQIKEFDGQLVPFDIFESIEESEHVTAVENNGLSGNYPHYNKRWFSVYLSDGAEIQLYIRKYFR